jgi:hypothetical protein
MIDGLWLDWCLDPANFRPAEAIALCESWIESLGAAAPRADIAAEALPAPR